MSGILDLMCLLIINDIVYLLKLWIKIIGLCTSFRKTMTNLQMDSDLKNRTGN